MSFLVQSFPVGFVGFQIQKFATERSDGFRIELIFSYEHTIEPFLVNQALRFLQIRQSFDTAISVCAKPTIQPTFVSKQSLIFLADVFEDMFFAVCTRAHVVAPQLPIDRIMEHQTFSRIAHRQPGDARPPNVSDEIALCT